MATKYKVKWNTVVEIHHFTGYSNYNTTHQNEKSATFETLSEAEIFINTGKKYGLTFELFKLEQVLVDKEVKVKI